MNKRTILIIGGAVAIVALLAIGLFFVLRGGAQDALRRTIIDNEDQASETADELQRTDRITTVLIGTGSAIAQVGPRPVQPFSSTVNSCCSMPATIRTAP